MKAVARLGSPFALAVLVATAFASVAVAQGQQAQRQQADSSGFSISGFIDSYYNLDLNRPKMPGANGSQFHRAYVRNNGFAVSFAAVELTHQTAKTGTTLSLRFGPSAQQLIGGAATALGLGNVKQAYVTYRPSNKLTLDFGQFDTVYGAEVADSFDNYNYTRGALYFAFQPFWHQGLRANFAANDKVSVTGLLVNGVNEAFDSDTSADLGIAVAVSPNATTSVSVGGYASLDPNGKMFAQFVDLVASMTSGKFSALFNADYGFMDPMGDGDSLPFYGVSLAGRIQLNEEMATAARFEYLADPDGATQTSMAINLTDGYLVTATGTFEYIPGDAQNLILRADVRLESSDKNLFYNDNGATDTFLSTIWGVVVKTI